MLNLFSENSGELFEIVKDLAKDLNDIKRQTNDNKNCFFKLIVQKKRKNKFINEKIGVNKVKSEKF